MRTLIKGDPDKTCTALFVEGWSMSLFGRPKLSIQCGNCYVTWRTRDWIPVQNRKQSAAVCPTCAWWNVFDLVYG